MDIVGMLAPVVVGWPAIIAANVLAIWGVLERRWAPLLAAAVVGLPFALYLTATPRFRLAGSVVALSLVVAALLVRQGQPRWAWIFILPLLAVSVWLAQVVVQQ